MLCTRISAVAEKQGSASLCSPVTYYRCNHQNLHLSCLKPMSNEPADFFTHTHSE